MRGKRYKKAQKFLSFYETSFDFRSPFPVLIDGTFCFLALKMKINLREQLPKYLGAECQLLTTTCCLHETTNLGPELHGALCVLKQFSLAPCNHQEKPLPASACLETLTRGGNTEKFLIASQDLDLQDKLRKKAGVPILYLHHHSLTLEKPSEKSLEVARTRQNEKLEPSGYQKDVIGEMKKRELGETSASLPPKRKRKGPKQPNPLSCKKSKKDKLVKSLQVEMKVGKSKGRRRHKRINMCDALKNIHAKLVKQAEANS
ncbi:rRNA-processing protein UTP23 homolog [Paramacrobiotus metropolitanus]|uniref:rRNA-processing protein UTP23 homolog n=1 Tax=Paramacrobiotus metropolitanus TaxID=2943436 RepID=UPI0024462C91|nr:rRNA-processing protein UTP23 homolog [Paramacrobiotus metropolitanus]